MRHDDPLPCADGRASSCPLLPARRAHDRCRWRGEPLRASQPPEANPLTPPSPPQRGARVERRVQLAVHGERNPSTLKRNWWTHSHSDSPPAGRTTVAGGAASRSGRASHRKQIPSLPPPRPKGARAWSDGCSSPCSASATRRPHDTQEREPQPQARSSRASPPKASASPTRPADQYRPDCSSHRAHDVRRKYTRGIAATSRSHPVQIHRRYANTVPPLNRSPAPVPIVVMLVLIAGSFVTPSADACSPSSGSRPPCPDTTTSHRPRTPLQTRRLPHASRCNARRRRRDLPSAAEPAAGSRT